MVNIKLLVIGKNKFDWLGQGMGHYQKLLEKYASLDLIVIKDEKVTKAKSREMILDKEAERILRYFERDSFRIALDTQGERFSSDDLAKLFSEKMTKGYNDFLFVIGGALGLSEKVVKNCQFKLSLSSMTFTHQLSRIILLEQVYRAFSILKGERYHK
jgi:23S rRNA (pseudouridine1915-N3)-methyltransferase